MKRRTIMLCTWALVCWLFPVQALPASDLSHGFTKSGNKQATQQEIDKFCQQYPKLEDSPNYSDKDRKRFKKLYDQYCLQKTKPGPIQPTVPEQDKPTTGLISQIHNPACLENRTEIRVRGKHLRQDKLKCQLISKGQGQNLHPYSSTDNEFRFRLGTIIPESNYELVCTTSRQKKRKQLQGCTKPETVESSRDAGVDLVATLKTGKLRPGENQTITVSISNHGSTKAQNTRYRVALALADRDLSRDRQHLSTAFSPVSGHVFVQKQQWVSRLPARGMPEIFPLTINIPIQLPAIDTLYWCSFVDKELQVTETNENNNLSCVPATRKPQFIARDDLAGLFGKDIPKIPLPNGLQTKQTPPLNHAKWFKKWKWPTAVQPIMLYLNSLTINGSPFGPVNLAEGSTAEVAWNFPSDSGVTLAFLRIVEFGFVSPCPSGQLRSEGHTELERVDSGWWDFPDRQYYLGPSGSISITLGSDRGFQPERNYSFQVCGLQQAPTDPTSWEFVHESNVLAMNYSGPPLPWLLGSDSLAEFLLAHRPDLVVGDMQLLTGRQRGKLMIAARDNGPTRGRVRDPFQYEVFVDERSVERGMMRPFIFGWVAVTTYRLPEDTWHTIRVVINNDHTYRESNYTNNSMTQHMALGEPLDPPPNRIIDTQIIQEAPDWAVISVRYTYVDEEPTDSSTGRGPMSTMSMRIEREDDHGRGRETMMPTCANENNVEPLVPNGVNQRIIFRCILREDGPLEKDIIHVEIFRPGSTIVPRERVLIRGRFGYSKTWFRGSERPDLIPEILGITERSLRPRTIVVVRVRNQGTASAPGSRLNVSSRFPDRIDNIQCNVDGSRVNDFHSIGVRGLLPGDQATYDVSLPCPYLHTRTAGEFEVMINADPAGSIIESNEDNNTSRSDTALLPHRVVPGSGGLRGGDTF